LATTTLPLENENCKCNERSRARAAAERRLPCGARARSDRTRHTAQTHTYMQYTYTGHLGSRASVRSLHPDHRRTADIHRLRLRTGRVRSADTHQFSVYNQNHRTAPACASNLEEETTSDIAAWAACLYKLGRSGTVMSPSSSTQLRTSSFLASERPSSAAPARR
jgi:hypothetical protein